MARRRFIPSPIRASTPNEALIDQNFRLLAQAVQSIQDALDAGTATSGSDLPVATSNLSGAVILAPTSVNRNLITPTAASYRGIAIQGHASQSAPLFYAQNNAGTRSVYIDQNLGINITNTVGGIASSSVYLETLSTGTGDPKVVFNISGGTPWAIGIDNDDSDAFVVSAALNLGSTDNRFRISSAGDVSIPAGNLSVSRSSTGTVSATVSNSNAGANAHAVVYLRADVADPIVSWMVSATPSWSLGVDNSTASDDLVLAAGASFGNPSTDAVRFSVGGTVTLHLGDLQVQRSQAAGDVKVQVQNTNVTAGSRAMVDVMASNNDSLIRFFGGTTSWGLGSDYSDSESFVLCNSSALGSLVVLRVSASQAVSLQPDSTKFLGFWGATPVDQPAHINDPSGGATQDAEARTAIASILDLLQETGLMAP